MDTPRNASAAVIGACDFIGAAIARRFAAGGYAVSAGRIPPAVPRPVAVQPAALLLLLHGAAARGCSRLSGCQCFQASPPSPKLA